MAQKKDTTVLILALLITLTLLSGGLWLITQKFNISEIFKSSSTPNAPPSTQQPPTSLETLAQVPNVPKGIFYYGGSTTWAPIRKEINPVIQAVFPQFKLQYTQPPNQTPGSGTGIEMLINNQITFVESSRPIQASEYQTAQQQGFTLQEIPVAVDAIVVAVHPRFTLPALTLSQLQDIYTGKVTNWSQLGGENLPVVAYSRSLEAGGTTEFFIENVLNGQPLAKSVKLLGTTTEALRAVSNNPGAIYYASAPEVVDQCTIKPLAIQLDSGEIIAPYQEPLVPPEACPQQRNQINTAVFQNNQYPLTRRLFVIVKQNNQIEQQAGIAYSQMLLTRQGQDLLEKIGFINIQ